jgi:glycosyltransferase involved in cell wall biosynthesis
MKAFANDARHVGRKLAMTIGRFFPRPMRSLTYVTERQSWAIAGEGAGIRSAILKIEPRFQMHISSRPYLSKSLMFHFGSQFMVENWLTLLPEDRKVIVSYFHGKFGDGREIDRNLRFLLDHSSRLDRVIVSFEKMRHRLISLGLAEKSIVRIPIGVSTDVFAPKNSPLRQLEIRSRLGIPEDHFVIGSFQKDGEGWGDGLVPKHIKGPDLLLQTLEIVSRKLPIFVLLSGPSRGYVVQGLKLAGIPYKHLLVDDHRDLAPMYHALDLYLMTSREEGGPKGLLEALASGCPVVSTPVGMAQDLITCSNSNSFKVSDTISVAELSELTIEIGSEGDRFSGQEDLSALVQHCSWINVGQEHFQKVYEPLLTKLST